MTHPLKMINTVVIYHSGYGHTERMVAAVATFGPDASAGSEGRRNTFDFPPVDRDRVWNFIAAMRVIADKHAVSVNRIALAWLLARLCVTSVIIGVKRIAQLTDNLRATDIVLTAEEGKHLDAISAMPLHYPGWMIDHQDAERYPKPFTSKAQN
ncbi:aldo/keto reductase [Pantoea sp. T14]|jgi:aryl-alcohol dehydrogenase-like predicted oxidoreductase|uniref:aldo/keto reductase n=1 Tax=Pantoea TaxID=53335 RepID=UPI001C062251|nr:aldo/keto reductase [Pantoea bituminis]